MSLENQMVFKPYTEYTFGEISELTTVEKGGNLPAFFVGFAATDKDGNKYGFSPTMKTLRQGSSAGSSSTFQVSYYTLNGEPEVFINNAGTIKSGRTG